jgi:hypothetical protein
LLIRSALAATAAAAAVVVPVTAANAQTWQHVDATHDVQSGVFDMNTNGMPDFTPDPTQADPDIKRVKVHYGARKVTVRTHFRDLTRSRDAISDYSFLLRTNEHKARGIDVAAGAGMWKGQAFMYSRHGDAHCKGLRHHISYRLHDVVVRVPRSCLSDPRWVQVAGVSVKATISDPATDTDGSQATMTMLIDDALSPKADLNKVNWSPRIHRG